MIVDYHGLEVWGISMDDHKKNDKAVLFEYCLEIENPKRVIDATSETCVHHLGNRCLGRFANHSLQRKGTAANMIMADAVLELVPNKPRVIVLVACTNIKPFEQFRFDYNNPVARALFKDT